VAKQPMAVVGGSARLSKREAVDELIKDQQCSKVCKIKCNQAIGVEGYLRIKENLKMIV